MLQVNSETLHKFIKNKLGKIVFEIPNREDIQNELWNETKNNENGKGWIRLEKETERGHNL